MIYKLEYGNRVKTGEIVVPWRDVYSGLYREKMIDVYKANKENYKVSEYHEGIVVALPADIIKLVDVPILKVDGKTKLKIREVFKKCLNEDDMHRQN